MNLGVERIYQNAALTWVIPALTNQTMCQVITNQALEIKKLTWALFLFSSYRRACGHVDKGTCPHQVLAATLTLSQPRGGRLCPPYTGVHTKF